MSRALIKDNKHDHYWIKDGILYESYETLRGLRYRAVLRVPIMPDCDKCTPEMITFIEKEYLI